MVDASDMGLLITAQLPHGVSWMTGLMTASLDHSMWFHKPFSFDHWILIAMESTASAGSRGLIQASMFTEVGELIGSVAHEGLMRQLKGGAG